MGWINVLITEFIVACVAGYYFSTIFPIFSSFKLMEQNKTKHPLAFFNIHGRTQGYKVR